MACSTGMEATRRLFFSAMNDSETQEHEQPNPFVMETPEPPRRRRRLNPLPNMFADDDITQENPETNVVAELKEIKQMLKGIIAKQKEMDGTLNTLKKELLNKDVDLAKSSHSVNLIKVFAKAYVQIGRFPVENASKTEQIKQELVSSHLATSQAVLFELALSFEKVKFIYWRAEERRRILAVGSWAALQYATTKEVSTKMASLLGVKFHSILEATLLKETALVRSYVSNLGLEQCRNDVHFWINYEAWKHSKFGGRGPTQNQWEEIMRRDANIHHGRE